MVTAKYTYNAFVNRGVDGDTVYVTIDLGLNVLTTAKLRLLGINAPEIRGAQRPKGLISKKALFDKIFGQEIVVKTHKDKQGKYGRWLAEIWLGKVNINTWLVRSGYAHAIPE